MNRPLLDSFADDSFAHEFFLEVFEKHPCFYEVIIKSLENAGALRAGFVEFATVVICIV